MKSKEEEEEEEEIQMCDWEDVSTRSDVRCSFKIKDYNHSSLCVLVGPRHRPKLRMFPLEIKKKKKNTQRAQGVRLPSVRLERNPREERRRYLVLRVPATSPAHTQARADREEEREREGVGEGERRSGGKMLGDGGRAEQNRERSGCEFGGAHHIQGRALSSAFMHPC
ncbi:unnamed protein product [Pleuronectes platessa]|uniref:Uncharacterized protein n=1 Tax=Pleuronectes platessa TaxID=8262 RepID=A0A9N7YBT0_PLEPL|nr:unnamed protein product [Pleuronectes platessa]